MSKGNRPATCASSGKRLRAKSWYYRDGKYFYNRVAWLQEKAKQAKESATAAPVPAADTAPKADAKPEPPAAKE